MPAWLWIVIGLLALALIPPCLVALLSLQPSSAAAAVLLGAIVLVVLGSAYPSAFQRSQRAACRMSLLGVIFAVFASAVIAGPIERQILEKLDLEVLGLWPVALREDLRKALIEEQLRKIETWTARHGVAIADWPATPVDPFFNVNTPEDAAEAERMAARQCDL